MNKVPRLAFKPDTSFFRKISIGVIGVRAVCADLGTLGHAMVELERGATETKLWKDIKRKRVRIPDLVCLHCGLRVECRAKTTPELAMSHSFTEDTRAWDFGMTDADCIAFPVCEAVDEELSASGKLGEDTSYWHERNWVRWRTRGRINYFTVSAFRAAPHTRTGTKGVEEGSETTISWAATFSTREGVVEAVSGQNVTIRRGTDGRRHTWRVKAPRQIVVTPAMPVGLHQVLAAVPSPASRPDLQCRGELGEGHITRLLESRERTLRFTGVKLARLLGSNAYDDVIDRLCFDTEEDVYVRLEAAAHLASVGGRSARELFVPYLTSTDPQIQLESVISLGEAANSEAVAMLCEILDSPNRPYFLRSAAAWCLSRVGAQEAVGRLIRAFSDVDRVIREEALEGLVSLGGPAIPALLENLHRTDGEIAAGCAEALRQQHLPETAVTEIMRGLHSPDPSRWAVWLAGNLPREQIAGAIAELQASAPTLHYAITLLWSFVESWIIRRWEVAPRAVFPN